MEKKAYTAPEAEIEKFLIDCDIFTGSNDSIDDGGKNEGNWGGTELLGEF